MPGIAGIISKCPNHENDNLIVAMINTMLHEDFYSFGTHKESDLFLNVGWVCHKDSFCDCMPVWNEKKDIALIYFGENFTDLELFDQLKAKHHRFDPTNASYLVHMYEEKGVDFLNDLNGWFSGLLIDYREKKLILLNDRFGMQKIFYYESKDRFFFASEAKALLKVCPELRILNTQGLGELLSCDCVLENRTLFNQVYLLPAGSCWIFEHGCLSGKTSYFDVSLWENQTWLDREFLLESLLSTFKKVLLRYFRSPQKIGISLTGGVDTRMIMAHYDMPEGKFDCYSFGGMYRDSFDVKIAHKIAIAKKQSHETIVVDQSFLNNFTKWADKTIYITDGYLGVTGSSEVYVNSIARSIAPIRMTGNFGGEIFRSMRHLKARSPMQTLFANKLLQYATNASSIIADLSNSSPLTAVLFQDSPWHNNNRLVSEQSQLTLRTPYMDNDLIALMYRLQRGIPNDKSLSLQLISKGDPQVSSFLTDKGLSGNMPFPASVIVPYFYEFLAKAEYAYDYGMPNWFMLLNTCFSFLHFDKLFLGRHKFNHYRYWFQEPLAPYVKDVLLDKRTLERPFWNKNIIEHVVDQHIKGVSNYTTQIAQLLSIELIHRRLIEQ